MRLIAIAAVLVAALILYLVVIRPWQLRWGATDAEVQRALPGDEVVSNPTFNATRAVTVQARPEHIWPWLVQIGEGRAGWYSYDWIDNLGRPSAETILPQFQHLQVGDLVPIYKDRGFRVRALVPGSWMLWGDEDGTDGLTWYWGLDPQADGSTRLITRVRLRYAWTSPAILFHLLLDVGDIVMMRKCLLGIRQRAEALAQAASAPAP